MPGEADEQWMPLVVTTGDHEEFVARYPTATKQSVIRFLTFDRKNPNSIMSCLWSARENARAVRESISSEMWEHINRFYLLIRESGAQQAALEESYDFFDQIRVSGQQFMGVTDATMTHGEAWHFCQLGRMIERADKTSRILDVKYFILLPKATDVGTPYDDIQWLALLRSASALEMYRQRHGQISPVNVVKFLVLDKEFPRAVLHCLTRANDSLHAISGTTPGGFSNRAEQRLGQLRAELAYTQAEEVVASGLHEFVDDFQCRLNTVGEAIHESFFAMRPLELAGAGK
jgi:uncharacterized alpha-E superfamily protein